jgi:hypothetical protein
MIAFTSKPTYTLAPADPLKHVRYTLGMVLGVDDFDQQFAYLDGHRDWALRDLVGYGTASGLAVQRENTTTGPRIVVTAGTAVSPRGQLIRVSPAQCAPLGEWLAAHQGEINQHMAALGSPPSDALSLFVTLCYADCPSDLVPIPGEPCRSEDDVMEPSRLADDFRLELRLEPPAQREEDAVRDFVAWLKQVEVVTSGAVASLAQFEQAIRDAAHLLASPPGAPGTDFMFGSPPASLRIHRDDACEFLRAAWRIWVTELRPLWRPDFLGARCGCHGDCGDHEAPEDCLLLAELSVPIVDSAGQWVVDSSADVTIDERRRPILVHQRMLQEWAACGWCCGDAP